MSYVYKLVSKRLYSLKHKWVRKPLYRYLRSYLWPNDPLNYPFKCRRYLAETDLFLSQRMASDDLRPRPLTVQSYADIAVDQRSTDIIEQVVSFYNRTLIKSRFCPQEVNGQDMQYMIDNCPEWHRCRRHLNFLFVREFDIWRHRRQNQTRKQENNRQHLRLIRDFTDIGCFNRQNELQYGFWRNSMFGRFYDKAPKRYSIQRLRAATLFGQTLIIDCEFDEEMQEYEIQSVGRQMSKIYNINRIEATDPFDIHYCGVNPDGRVYKNLMKYLYPLSENFDQNYINIHHQSYRELFADQRLVYLSPDARDVMEEFDPTATYILGSLVGKTCRLPLTKLKAEREGLECVRLPIHRYVQLNPMVKRTLSFQGVFRILMEMKAHNNWELAFRRGIQDHKIKQKQVI